MMGKIIHLFAHTHWDREWYFTTSRSKVYLMKNLSDVIDLLESDSSFTSFLLDGQSSLIDEYLAWRPQDTDRIKHAIVQRRLLIGPWYTQCDQLIISAESVVRNLYYGITRARELGHSMMIGYVPDAFGQGGNMPQIYHSFGIDDVIIVRGVSDDMTKRTNFFWCGSDGTEVLTTQMRTGYSIAEFIPSDAAEADEFWRTECLEKEAPRFATEHVLFPIGFDQAPIRRELPEIVLQRNQIDPANTYVLDSLEDYAAAVRKTGIDFETVKGELLSGKLRRIHRSIYSSRSDLKALNTATQNYVSNVLEPLLALSHGLGNDYPHKAIESVWKLLFENSAHDSIGSCVSDTVNEEIRLRYKQASDIASSLVELHSRLIATAVKGAKEKFSLTLINTLPWKRSDVLIKKLYISGSNFSIIDDGGKALPYSILCKRDLTAYVKKQTINLDPSRKIYTPESIYEAIVAIAVSGVPPFGYLQCEFQPNSSGALVNTTLHELRNEFYTIGVNKDGSLRIEDKINGYVYDNEAVLVENGDDGDSFNYSPPRNDMTIRSSDFKPIITITGSDIYQQAIIVFEMVVPADLDERARGVSTTKLPVTMTVGLRNMSRIIDLKVKIDNCVKSHRMCIQFDADMVTKFNYADELFGSICRPNRLDQERTWYKRDMAQGNEWNEKPVAIQPTQSFVSLFSDDRGIAVIPQGVREYEIVDRKGMEGGEGNIISLTLFRTYGYMGKKNLLYRPGHASGEETIATPEAQLLHPLSFSLGFATFQSEFETSQIERLAKEYNTPLQSYEYSSFLNGRLIFSEPERTGALSKRHWLFKLCGDLAVSTIKKAEKLPGIVIRLYSAKRNHKAGARLIFSRAIANASYLNLLEEKIGRIETKDHEVPVGPLDPSKVVSIYVEFD